MLSEIKLKNKVLILGSSYNTLKDAPIKDDSYTVIALSGFQNECVDIYFEMHDRKSWRKEAESYLKRCNKKIVCKKQQTDIKNTFRFPIEESQKALNRTYFTSSIAYILAFLFMREGIEEIAIFGVDLTAKEEYQEQRPCCEYLIGRLEGKGIKITIPEKSALLKSSHLYGYEKKKEGTLNIEYFLSRKELLLKEKELLEDKLNRVKGSIYENEHHIKNYKKIQRGGSFIE